METEVKKRTFLLRRGFSYEWEEKNPVLFFGEPGVSYSVDNENNITGYELKIGDGVKAWSELSSIGIGSNIVITEQDFELIISELINKYVIKGAPQENGERLPAAGVIFSAFRPTDDPTDTSEYGPDSLMLVEGKSAFAAGKNIKIFGDKENDQDGSYAVSLGANHNIYGYCSTSFGSGALVYPHSKYSFTAGLQLTNYGNRAIVLGTSNKKAGELLKDKDIANISKDEMLNIFKGANKYGAIAYGDFSTNLGTDNITYGHYSVAIGDRNFAGGKYSMAMGHRNETLGNSSIAIGSANIADGEGAVAVGKNNKIVNNGYDPLGAFVSGYDNIVSGGYAFAGGIKSQATRYGSFALGYGIKTDNRDAMFVGRLNDNTDSSIIFGVGNGTGDVSNISLSEDAKSFVDGEDIKRKNAFTVHSDGHAEVQKQGTNDKSVARVDYVKSVADEVKEYTNMALDQNIATIDTKIENCKTEVKEYTDLKVSELENDIEETLMENLYIQDTFETPENYIDLTNMVSQPISISLTKDLDDTNVIIENGIINENTLGLPAYSQLKDKFEIASMISGKNLMSRTSWVAQGGRYIEFFKPPLPAGTYTISGEFSGGRMTDDEIQWIEADKVIFSLSGEAEDISFSLKSGYISHTFTIDKPVDQFAIELIDPAGNEVWAEAHNMQLERGEKATACEEPIWEYCLYAETINSDGYYRGWTGGATTDTKIHLETGKDYVLAFDLIGEIGVYGVGSRVSFDSWHYFTNKSGEWKTQILHFRTADTIDNYNYIISFGCPKTITYNNVYIKNIRVLDDPCLQVLNGENVEQELLYNPEINGFDNFVPTVSEIQLRLVNKTEGDSYESGLKGTYYKPISDVVSDLEQEIEDIKNSGPGVINAADIIYDGSEQYIGGTTVEEALNSASDSIIDLIQNKANYSHQHEAGEVFYANGSIKSTFVQDALDYLVDKVENSGSFEVPNAEDIAYDGSEQYIGGTTVKEALDSASDLIANIQMDMINAKQVVHDINNGFTESINSNHISYLTVNVADAYTVEAALNYLFDNLGSIETALDNIIRIQEDLMIPDGDEVEY